MDPEALTALFNLLDGGSTFVVMLAWITLEVRRSDAYQKALFECVRNKQTDDTPPTIAS